MRAHIDENKTNLEEREQEWNIYNTNYLDLLYSYSN